MKSENVLVACGKTPNYFHFFKIITQPLHVINYINYYYYFFMYLLGEKKNYICK